MNRFAIAQPHTLDEASTMLQDKRYTLPVLKAGGIDLLDHMKEGLSEPDVLIDVKSLRSSNEAQPNITKTEHGFRIEGCTTLSELAASPELSEMGTVLAQAADDAATPQIRNVATVAGNLMQRPRCWYYRAQQYDCLKKGGHTCYAVDGENKFHAIFGEGPCHIVHPSNLAPAFYALSANIHVTGGDREMLHNTDLYHMPKDDFRTEHNLQPGEVITHITCKAAIHTAFYSIKEKQSFDWPLVFAGVNLQMDEGKIRRAQVCAGGVAPIHWPLKRVEFALRGVNPNDDAALRSACAIAAEQTQPMSQNAYKLTLLPVAIRRAVRKAAHLDVEDLTS